MDNFVWILTVEVNLSLDMYRGKVCDMRGEKDGVLGCGILTDNDLNGAMDSQRRHIYH